MNRESSESAEFRGHIRNLLYEYSVTHYTTNYTEFTEDLVGEFVEKLAKIPLVDRYSLTRPPDPFDAFCQINSFSTLSPYDELPKTTHDAVSYLKNATKSRGVARTDTAVHNDDYGPLCPIEPFMPALTRKARENTPRPGIMTQGLPNTLAHLLTTQNIKTLEIEPVEGPKIIPEDVIDIKHRIKPEELSAVQSLLRSAADVMRPRTDYKNKYLQPEYLNDTPFLESYKPEELFPPIFTKDRQPRSGIKAAKPAAKLCEEGFKSFSEVPALALKKVDTSDLEVSASKQNLVVVDGWETIRSSPPSTPESSQSDDDRVDQLLLPSSPDTDPPPITEFLQAKMEPIMMPRARTIGGNSGIEPHILAGKSLNTFLKPLLSPIVIESEKKERAESRCQISPVPSSMIGEPDTENEPPASKDQENLDAQITALCAGHPLEDIILAESIDDKPNMMMDVPDLSGPNVHPPNAMFIPRSGVEFLVSKRADNQQLLKKSALPMHQFLSKAKGISPLNTSLSWVMFKTDKQLPSNEEVVGVDKLLGDKTSDGCSETDLQAINALIETLDLGEKERLPGWDDDSLDCFQQRQLHDDFQILQTREERWRLARLEGRLTDIFEDDPIESLPERLVVEDDISDYDERLENDRPAKRPRVDDQNVTDSKAIPSTACSPCLSQPQAIDGSHTQNAVAADDAQALNSPVESLQASQMNIPIDLGNNLADPDPDSAPLEDDIYCDDFGDDFDKNKENWPPNTSSLPAVADDASSDYHTPEHIRHYLAAQYDMDDSLSQCYPESLAENPDEGFQALSFGTKQPNHNVQLSDNWAANEAFDAPCADRTEQSYTMEAAEARKDSARTEPTRRQPDKSQNFKLLMKLSTTSHLSGISDLAELRARKVSSLPEIPAPQIETLPQLEIEPTRPEATSADVVDQNTLQLPRMVYSASSAHRYMASIDFIQKHALVRALSSEECAIELAERPSLVGADLIVDPYSAVIILSLFTLSPRCDECVECVAQQSWRYSKLLILFEAYPEQLSKRSYTKYGVDSSGAPSELCAYTPPIIKAIKKFRRDLSVAEACGTKDPKSNVTYAFADTVNEAALFIRFFGDRIEAEDETQGALWGERKWLSAEFDDDEEARIAVIPGMNEFKASIILCEATPQEFVDMSAQQRIDAFAPYVGMDTMVSCNAYIDARLQEVYLESNTEDPDVVENENGS